MKKILIISYKFPPVGGVGTRRWAKFAKYFANSGYEVHVITIKYNKYDKMNWMYDIENNNNIIIHKIGSNYPTWLLQDSRFALILFIKKIISYLLRKTFFYTGISHRWHRKILPKAKCIINNNDIKNVITTNPPAATAYISTYLKIDLPKINLIQDFRDSWNDDKIYNYPSSLKSFKQKERSAYMEWFVMNHSDYIINVTEDNTKRLQNKFKQYKTKCITIYNGYDTEDIKNIDIALPALDKIKLIYAGSLGGGRVEAINLIMDYLLVQYDSIFKHIELNIYTSFSPLLLSKKYNKLIQSKIVNFYDFIPPDKILSVINQHHYCISINAKSYAHNFGTKIFDYMALGRGIIHISEGGELSYRLQELGQFVTDYNPSSIKNILDKIIHGKNTNITQINNNYDEFNIKNLIKDIKKILQ